MIDEERARELYEQGLSDRTIAVKLGTSRGEIRKWRIANGLPSKYKPPTKIDDWGKVRALYDSGLYDAQIAKCFNVAGWTISNWRKRNNLPRNYHPKQGLVINSSEQPCWHCKKYAFGCSWSESKGETPVKGWIAEPSVRSRGTAEEYRSWKILFCPEKESDGTEEKTEESDDLDPEEQRMLRLLRAGETDQRTARKMGVPVRLVVRYRREFLEKGMLG